MTSWWIWVLRGGTASPCVSVHKQRGLRCVVHGDDCTLLGCRANLVWFEEAFGEHVEIKLRGRLGEAHDCDKSTTILNRVLKVEDYPYSSAGKWSPEMDSSTTSAASPSSGPSAGSTFGCKPISKCSSWNIYSRQICLA